jgi:hypothetical protein
LSKKEGKDFAKTVVIPPEENDMFRHGSEETPEMKHEKAIGWAVKGPPKGLSGWSVFFLLVIAVVLGFGIVSMLML